MELLTTTESSVMAETLESSKLNHWPLNTFFAQAVSTHNMDITRCVYSNQSLKLTFKQKLNPNWKIQFSMNADPHFLLKIYV